MEACQAKAWTAEEMRRPTTGVDVQVLCKGFAAYHLSPAARPPKYDLPPPPPPPAF